MASRVHNMSHAKSPPQSEEWLLWRLFNQQVDEESEEEIVVQTTPGRGSEREVL